MRPVVFLHNPKAGGTSITSYMKSLYPANEVAPTLETSATARSFEAWLPHRKCQFVAGHFGHEVREDHFPGHALITNFRHPFNRVLSLYRFWRNVPAAQMAQLPSINGPAFAKSLSFAEFIESDDPFLRVYLDNFHARQILRSGWLWWECDEDDLQKAKQRVQSMDWFYICELPALSLSWLKFAFPDRSFPEVFPKMNESSGTLEASPTSREVAVVLRRNMLDLELYHTALHSMASRF